MTNATASTTSAASTSSPATPAPASVIDQDMVSAALKGVVAGFVPPQTETFEDTKLPAHYTRAQRRMASLLGYDLYRGLPKVALAWRRRHAMEADVIPQDSGSIRWLLSNSLQLKMAEAETRREISRHITNLRLSEIRDAEERTASATERMARAMENQSYAVEQGIAKVVSVVEGVGAATVEVVGSYGEMAPAIKTAVETLTPVIVAEAPQLGSKITELIGTVNLLATSFSDVALAAHAKFKGKAVAAAPVAAAPVAAAPVAAPVAAPQGAAAPVAAPQGAAPQGAAAPASP